MLQFLLSGLAIGSIYGLMGMALAICFYVTRVINFAQGQLMMTAIMLTAAISFAGYSPWLAVAVGLVCAIAIAVLSYLVAVKPILAFDRFSFGWLVSTLGFAVVVENAAAYIWGPTSRAFPPILNASSVHIADAVLTEQQVLAILVAAGSPSDLRAHPQAHVVREAGHGDRGGSRDGLGHRREHDRGRDRGLRDLRAVRGGGGRADRAQYFRQSLSRRYLRHFGFIAMMIGGGTEKPAAAMFGGLLLGVLSEGANALINSQASDWFPFLVLVVILVVTPRGLFSSGSVLHRLWPARLARR